MPLALVVSGAAILVHEQNDWTFPRSPSCTTSLGWTAIIGALLPARSAPSAAARLVWNAGFALTFVVLAVFLYADRDLAPIFGHLSPLAGEPHR